MALNTGSKPDFIANQLINQTAQFNTLGSAPCCVCIYPGTKPQYVYYSMSSTADNYEAELVHWVDHQLQVEPSLTMDNFTRWENPVFDNIYDARRILLASVLPAKRNPHSKYKRDVIVKMGNALDQQTGFNFTVKQMSIPQRLETLCGRTNPWCRDFIDHLHKYHNACKHSDQKKHREALEEISGIGGVSIAARYFEAVRKFFVWYLKGKGGSQHPDLQSIDYGRYGLTISVGDP